MRRTIRSRLSTGYLLFDALVVRSALDNVLHEDPRSVNAIRIERARLRQLLDFGDRVPRRGGHHRIEVARGLPIDQVALAVALPRFHECEVGVQRFLEDIRAAVDDA